MLLFSCPSLTLYFLSTLFPLPDFSLFLFSWPVRFCHIQSICLLQGNWYCPFPFKTKTPRTSVFILNASKWLLRGILAHSFILISKNWTWFSTPLPGFSGSPSPQALAFHSATFLCHCLPHCASGSNSCASSSKFVLFYAWVLFLHVCMCTAYVQVPVEPEECLGHPELTLWTRALSKSRKLSYLTTGLRAQPPHRFLNPKNLPFKLKASQSLMLFAFLSFQTINTLQALILLWNLSFTLKLKLIF